MRLILSFLFFFFFFSFNLRFSCIGLLLVFSEVLPGEDTSDRLGNVLNIAFSFVVEAVELRHDLVPQDGSDDHQLRGHVPEHALVFGDVVKTKLHESIQRVVEGVFQKVGHDAQVDQELEGDDDHGVRKNLVPELLARSGLFKQGVSEHKEGVHDGNNTSVSEE